MDSSKAWFSHDIAGNIGTDRPGGHPGTAAAPGAGDIPGGRDLWSGRWQPSGRRWLAAWRPDPGTESAGDQRPGRVPRLPAGHRGAGECVVPGPARTGHPLRGGAAAETVTPTV